MSPSQSAAGKSVFGEFMPTFLCFGPKLTHVTFSCSPLTRTNHMSQPNNEGIRNGGKHMEYQRIITSDLCLTSLYSFQGDIWLGLVDIGTFRMGHSEWVEFLLASPSQPSFLCSEHMWFSCCSSYILVSLPQKNIQHSNQIIKYQSVPHFFFKKCCACSSLRLHTCSFQYIHHTHSGTMPKSPWLRSGLQTSV